MKKNLILTSLAALVATSAANAASYTGADLTFGGESKTYTGTPSIDAKGNVTGITVNPVEYSYKTWDAEKKAYVIADKHATTDVDHTVADTDPENTRGAVVYSYTGALKVSNTDGSERAKIATDAEFTGSIAKAQTQNTVDVESNNSIFASAATYNFDGNVNSNIINVRDYYADLGTERVNVEADVFNNAEKFDLLGTGTTSFAEVNKTATYKDYIANVHVKGGTSVVSERGELNRELTKSDITLTATNGITYAYNSDDELIDITKPETVVTPTAELTKELAALDAAIGYVFDPSTGSVVTAENATKLGAAEQKVYDALIDAYEADKAAMDAKSGLFASYKDTLEAYNYNEGKLEEAKTGLASREKNAANMAKANVALEEASILDVIDGEAEAAIATSLEEGGAIRNAIDAGDARTLAAANAYTDKKVDTLEKDISGGVAAATALSAVNVSGVSKGEVSVGGGYGYYNGESAVAFGAAMGLTDRWSVNAGAGIASGNDTQVSFRAGTNYKFKLF